MLIAELGKHVIFQRNLSIDTHRQTHIHKYTHTNFCNSNMVQDAVIEVPFENQTIIVFISFYQNYHSCEIN